jgi:hypothetical protein
MRRGRIVHGTACTEANSPKHMNLAILKEAEFTIRMSSQLLSRGGGIQPEPQCLLGSTIQATYIGTIVSLGRPSGRWQDIDL